LLGSHLLPCELLSSVHGLITSLKFNASYSLALAVTPFIIGMMIAIIMTIMIMGIMAENMLVQSVPVV
jgi:hypothetical protein